MHNENDDDNEDDVEDDDNIVTWLNSVQCTQWRTIWKKTPYLRHM